MKSVFLVAALAFGGLASAQSMQEACNGIGALGKTLAAERDKGVSLQQQLQKNEAAVDGSRDASVKQLMDSVARTVHGSMKTVSPEEMFWRLRTLCLTARQ